MILVVGVLILVVAGLVVLCVLLVAGATLVVLDCVVGVEEVEVFEGPAFEQPPIINVPDTIKHTKLRTNPLNNF